MQTIDGLGPTAFNTVVLAVPVEMFEAMTSLRDAIRGRAQSEPMARTQA